MYSLNWHRSFDVCKLVDARRRWWRASTRLVWTGLKLVCCRGLQRRRSARRCDGFVWLGNQFTVSFFLFQLCCNTKLKMCCAPGPLCPFFMVLRACRKRSVGLWCVLSSVYMYCHLFSTFIHLNCLAIPEYFGRCELVPDSSASILRYKLFKSYKLLSSLFLLTVFVVVCAPPWYHCASVVIYIHVRLLYTL